MLEYNRRHIEELKAPHNLLGDNGPNRNYLAILGFILGLIIILLL